MSSGFDAANPFSWNPFEPPKTEHAGPAGPAAPRSRAPRMFPEQDRLFRVQRAAYDAVTLCADVRRRLGRDVPEEFDRLERRVTDSYKLIRNYLYDYTQTQV